MEWLELLGAAVAGAVAITGAYATVKRLKPQEKSDIATAASAVANAAATLVDPMAVRIAALEERLSAQNQHIGSLEGKIEILIAENYRLRDQLQAVKEGNPHE